MIYTFGTDSNKLSVKMSQSTFLQSFFRDVLLQRRGPDRRLRRRQQDVLRRRQQQLRQRDDGVPVLRQRHPRCTRSGVNFINLFR